MNDSSPMGLFASLVTVRFLPTGREITVTAGTSLLEAARAAGLPLGSSCDGEGSCAWCRVQVLTGLDALSPASAEELHHLARVGASPHERLACQAAVRGPVEISTTYW